MNGEIVKNRGISKLENIFLISVISLICIFISSIILNESDTFRKYDAENNIESSNVNLIFTGDIMLDRNVRILINKNGFDKFFSGVKDIISPADIAIGNLEGPFTDNSSLTEDFNNKTLQFTFDPKGANSLADLGFDILGLANNHTLNFGQVGFASTKRYISNAGMIYYGDPLNKSEISTIVTRNGIKIGFIGFHEFNYVNFDNVFSEIMKLRPDVDVLIVTPHWGVEYQKEPTQNMSDLAHKFIDSGADMVIGTHPHIIGDTEAYKDKKIYYSLGNFAFDQYFSKETMEGLTVKVKIEKGANVGANTGDNGKNISNIKINFEDIKVKVDKNGVNVNTI